MKKTIISMAVILCVLAVSVQAAFIVEPHSTGRGSSNFSSTVTPVASDPGTTPGLLADHSIYGGSGSPDIYTYTYTPGTDADNWDVPAYEYFGNGQYTTNLTGGRTGYYNVYITWLPSTNVAVEGCDLYITHDGGVQTWLDVDMRTGGSNWIAESWDYKPGSEIHGANNKWLKIAHEVLLTEGNTYTVTQEANNPGAWVSMRSSGVMWEFVAVPEPVTLALLGVGGLLIRRRR